MAEICDLNVISSDKIVDYESGDQFSKALKKRSLFSLVNNFHDCFYSRMHDYIGLIALTRVALHEQRAALLGHNRADHHRSPLHWRPHHQLLLRLLQVLLWQQVPLYLTFCPSSIDAPQKSSQMKQHAL